MKTKIPLAILILLSCSGKPTPKDVVFDFIKAVKSSDSLEVARLLDVDAYIQYRMAQMTPEDSAQVLAEHRKKTFESVLKDGQIRTHWKKSQILVNRATESDSLAEVEVSFMDKQTAYLLYTKIVLKRGPDGTWRIVWFQ